MTYTWFCGPDEFIYLIQQSIQVTMNVLPQSPPFINIMLTVMHILKTFTGLIIQRLMATVRSDSPTFVFQ